MAHEAARLVLHGSELWHRIIDDGPLSGESRIKRWQKESAVYWATD